MMKAKIEVAEAKEQPAYLLVRLPLGAMKPDPEGRGLLFLKSALDDFHWEYMDWRSAVQRHRWRGNTCPTCGVLIDDRSQGCVRHNPARGKKRKRE